MSGTLQAGTAVRERIPPVAPYRFSEWRVRELLGRVRARPSSDVESEQVEFKCYGDARALHNAKDLPEEISALANKDGGVIIVGVAPESAVQRPNWPEQLVGFDGGDILEIKERLVGKMAPKLDLSVRTVNYVGRSFLVVEVPRAQDSLVATTGGKYYIRDGRSSRPMDPGEVERAVKSLGSYDWTNELVDAAPDEVLDTEAVRQAGVDFSARRSLTGALEDSAFLEAIGATREGQLVRGGLLFLGKASSIREHLGGHEYRFSWKTRAGKLLVNDVWEGCIWSAVNRARDRLRICNTKQQFQYKGQTFEAPLLDDTAFHEAYLNALVHRDYSSDGMVSVNFTGERIVISSPGTFYGGVTAENIGRHDPRHRNKLLARILMAHQLVDRAGMGVLRMSLGSLRYGRGFPEFTETPDSVRVSMEAEFIRPGVAVLWMDNQDEFGVAELLILNSVYGTGYVHVGRLESRLSRMSDRPWETITRAVQHLDMVELCGNQRGVFVRVRPDWREVLRVERLFRPPTSSDKHVALYSMLRKYGTASNADIGEILEHAHASQTSRFLKDARYVERTGSGRSTRWSLVQEHGEGGTADRGAS